MVVDRQSVTQQSGGHRHLSLGRTRQVHPTRGLEGDGLVDDEDRARLQVAPRRQQRDHEVGDARARGRDQGGPQVGAGVVDDPQRAADGADVPRRRRHASSRRARGSAR